MKQSLDQQLTNVRQNGQDVPYNGGAPVGGGSAPTNVGHRINRGNNQERVEREICQLVMLSS